MNWWETTVVIGAGVLTLYNLIDKIVNTVKATKNPIDDLKRRVEELERKNEEIYPKYDKKILEIESGNRVTQKALLELLKHSIDGNNIDGLKDAEKELAQFLINK